MHSDNHPHTRPSERFNQKGRQDSQDENEQLDGKKIFDWLQGEQSPQLDREMARYLFGDNHAEEDHGKPCASGGSQC